MIRISPGDMINPQQLAAAVAGPDGANTLLIFDGQFRSQLNAQNVPFGAPIKETFSLLLGPQLTRRQFIKATVTASISKFSFNSFNAQAAGGLWSIEADADWDDESGQIELRVEVSVASGQMNTTADAFVYAYHVTALAEM